MSWTQYAWPVCSEILQSKASNMPAQHALRLLQWTVIPQRWFPKTFSTLFRKAISSHGMLPCAEKPLAGHAHNSYVGRCRAVGGAHRMVDSRSRLSGRKRLPGFKYLVIIYSPQTNIISCITPTPSFELLGTWTLWVLDLDPISTF